MNPPVPLERVDAVRAFNRFYTNLIGVVGEGLLETPYSLTEARVLFELAQRESSEVTVLRRSLGLDAGYLSRILSRFESDGLIRRERSAADARRQVAGLTDRGRSVFRELDARSGDQIGGILTALPEDEQRRLVGAMEAIRSILGERPKPEMYVLRAFGPGDYGTRQRTFVLSLEDDYAITGKASVEVPTTLMAIFGFADMPVKVQCQAQLNMANTDVMMVLDVTGSMAETNPGDSMSKIDALKATVRSFYAQLSAAAEARVTPPAVAADVHQHADQPRFLGRRLVWDRLRRTRRAQERVLHQVSGLFGAAGHAPRQPIQPHVMTIEQRRQPLLRRVVARVAGRARASERQCVLGHAG